MLWRDVRTIPTLVGRATLGMHYDFVAAHAYGLVPRRTRAAELAVRLREELRSARSG